MRDIEYLVIFDTQSRIDITGQQIVNWETRPKKFKGFGLPQPRFHIYINPDGTVYRAVDDKDTTLRVKAFFIGVGSETITISRYNSVSVAYVGGLSSDDNYLDTRTSEQNTSLQTVISNYISLYPTIKILGNNQIEYKSESPNFFLPTDPVFSLIPPSNLYPYDNHFYQVRVRPELEQLPYDESQVPDQTKRFHQLVTLVANQWLVINHKFALQTKDDIICDFFMNGERVALDVETLDTHNIRIKATIDVDLIVSLLGLT